jgi:hypothetical protein
MIADVINPRCTGKHPYRTRGDARARITAQRDRGGMKGRGRGSTLAPYLCDCGAWHIGNETK